MNETFNIGDKVKILRKPENGGGFTEVGRGMIVGQSTGKNSDWIRFIEYVDGRFVGLDHCFAESICVNAPCIRVVKW